MSDIDGNLYALNNHLAEREEYDRYQELLDAEAERDELLDRIEELEAKLAKAAGALEKLVDCVEDGCFCSEMEMATAMDQARATIEKLKGGDA